MRRDPGFGDVRRVGRVTRLLTIVMTFSDLVVAPPVSAQGFGWGYYRTPTQSRRAPRSKPGARPTAPRAVAPRPPGPAEPVPEAQVPLPVPRPHFPGDLPPQPNTPSPEPERRPPAAPSKAPEKPVAAPAKPIFGPFKPPPGKSPGPAADVPKPPAPAAPTPPETVRPAPPGPANPPATPPSTPPLPPPKPAELGKPGIAPSGARLGEAPGQPEDDASCQDRVKARGVEAESADIGPQPDPRCTVVRAVRLNGLTLRDGSKVSFPERPTIACPLADAFSLYIRDLLSPLAKGTYGAPIASVWTGPGLECRSRDHIEGAKLSAHGQGLAVDIAQLKLTDGRMIEVGRPKADTDQGFETAARAAACGYFHTALGPGTDSFHATHWHFDLEVRGAHGDSKYCK